MYSLLLMRYISRGSHCRSSTSLRAVTGYRSRSCPRRAASHSSLKPWSRIPTNPRLHLGSTPETPRERHDPRQGSPGQATYPSRPNYAPCAKSPRYGYREACKMDKRPSVSRAAEIGDGVQRRAATACKVCHSRKVRCNISADAATCSNCERDGRICVPHISQRKRARHVSSTTDSGPARESAIEKTAPLRDQSEDPISSMHRSDDNGRLSTEGFCFDTEPSSTSPTAEEDCRSNIEGYKSIFSNNHSQDPRVVLFMGKIGALYIQMRSSRYQQGSPKEYALSFTPVETGLWLPNLTFGFPE